MHAIRRKRELSLLSASTLCSENHLIQLHSVGGQKTPFHQMIYSEIIWRFGLFALKVEVGNNRQRFSTPKGQQVRNVH